MGGSKPSPLDILKNQTMAQPDVMALKCQSSLRKQSRYEN